MDAMLKLACVCVCTYIQAWGKNPVGKSAPSRERAIYKGLGKDEQGSKGRISPSHEVEKLFQLRVKVQKDLPELGVLHAPVDGPDPFKSFPQSFPEFLLCSKPRGAGHPGQRSPSGPGGEVGGGWMRLGSFAEAGMRLLLLLGRGGRLRKLGKVAGRWIGHPSEDQRLILLPRVRDDMGEASLLAAGAERGGGSLGKGARSGRRLEERFAPLGKVLPGCV